MRRVLDVTVSLQFQVPTGQTAQKMQSNSEHLPFMPTLSALSFASDRAIPGARENIEQCANSFCGVPCLCTGVAIEGIMSMIDIFLLPQRAKATSGSALVGYNRSF